MSGSLTPMADGITPQTVAMVGNPMNGAFPLGNLTPDDFAKLLGQIRPLTPNIDPRMAVQPYADPGYAMPNAPAGNLNQAPGQTVGGWLPAAAQRPSGVPTIPSYDPGQFDPRAIEAQKAISQVPGVPGRRMTPQEIEDALSPIAPMPSGARVPPDVVSDVGPLTMGHWLEPYYAVSGYTPTGDYTTSPIYPANPNADRAFDRRQAARQASGIPQSYADVILRAIQNRQRQIYR